MKPSRLWDFLFLYSNYHLEHHYFPRVPFFNLRRLHMRLRPLYAEVGLRPHTYREIAWQWFVLNKMPHTNWEVAQGAPTGPGSPTGDREPQAVEPRAAPNRVAARAALR
jgi:fatty acid desaturase